MCRVMHADIAFALSVRSQSINVSTRHVNENCMCHNLSKQFSFFLTI